MFIHFSNQLLDATNPFRSLECVQILIPPHNYLCIFIMFLCFLIRSFLFSLNYQFRVTLIDIIILFSLFVPKISSEYSNLNELLHQLVIP
jgi:hypothetical protein